MKNITACIYCKKPVIGRSDKKYCNDHCRSEYNNRKKRGISSDYTVNRINNILIQNRLVLSRITGNHKLLRVSNEQLITEGFHFNFYTHTVKVNEQVKFFCYDIGYVKTDNNEVVVFKIVSS